MTIEWRHLVVCIAVIIWATPSAAWACSCGGTSPVVYSADGVIPTDLGGFAVWPGDNNFDAEYDPFVAVQRWVDGAWVDEDTPVEAIENPGGFERYGTLAFVRPFPFQTGDRFRVRAGFDTAPVDRVEVEIEVGEPLPAIVGQPKLLLGELEPMSLVVGIGTSCSTAAWSATRRVDIELPAELEPYRDLLFYETTVDGMPWRPTTDLCSPNPIGRSWQDDPGSDLLVAACAYPFHDYETALLDESSFAVQIHAYFPGVTYPVWSTPQVQTDLTCPEDCVAFDGYAEEFVPCSPGGDAGNSNSPDAGNGDDIDGNGRGGGENGGCSSVHGASAPAIVLMVIGFGLLRRRRRGSTCR